MNLNKVKNFSKEVHYHILLNQILLKRLKKLMKNMIISNINIIKIKRNLNNV